MSDEQTTSGNNLSPAVNAPVPRQTGPAMDVVPPPDGSSVEPEVVDAPPEDVIPPMSDEIAEQIAADAVTQSAPVETPAASQPVAEAPVDKSEEQTSAVHEELKRQKQTHEVAEIPKTPNPGRSAAIITVFATLVLAGLAVFAYMSAQK